MWRQYFVVPHQCPRLFQIVSIQIPRLFNQNVLRLVWEVRVFGSHPSTYMTQSSPNLSRTSLTLWLSPASCSRRSSRNAVASRLADESSEEGFELVRSTAPSDSRMLSSVERGVLLGYVSMRRLSPRAGDMLGEDLVLGHMESER